jgi:hypothetical protein
MAPNADKSGNVHTFIAIRVDSYDVISGTGINSSVLGRLLNLNRDDPMFESATRLEIRGAGTYPEERLDHKFDITICEEQPSRSSSRVKDFHVLDKHKVPRYRKNRGKHVPIYDFPLGLAVIERRRSDAAWSAWVAVEPKIVTNMLVMLGHALPRYLSIHEMKVERRRWIRSISLQTTDPATE